MSAYVRGSMRLLFVLSAASAAAFTFETVRGPEGWPRRAALAQEIDKVSRDIEGLEAQVKALQRQIVAERERPEVQEALVRDFLGYVRASDVVLRGPTEP